MRRGTKRNSTDAGLDDSNGTPAGRTRSSNLSGSSAEPDSGAGLMSTRRLRARQSDDATTQFNSTATAKAVTLAPPSSTAAQSVAVQLAEQQAARQRAQLKIQQAEQRRLQRERQAAARARQQRLLKRSRVKAKAAALVDPAHWQPVAVKAGHSRHLLLLSEADEHTAELAEVKQHWKDTGGFGRVVSVHRIQNSALHRRFEETKYTLEQQRRGQKDILKPVEEMVAYHGTRSNVPAFIYDSPTGFDVSRCVSAAGSVVQRGAKRRSCIPARIWLRWHLLLIHFVI
jgi:hypothetical protein